MRIVSGVHYRSLIVAVLVAGCAQAVLTPALHTPGALPAKGLKDGALKVHMRSGELYQLTSWSLVDSARLIRGTGTRYTIDRQATPAESISVSLDSVALFETNSHDETYALGLQGVGALAVLGGIMSVACIADPKSCFGSCPTFYMEGPDSARVRAEGFSASVAKVLESRDVDALGRVASSGRELAIHMRNEAWETHFVRGVNMLAVPVSSGDRIFASSDSTFVRATDVASPRTCSAPEGDCLPTMSRKDDVERFSSADSTDLAVREVVELTFATAAVDAGVVITARNSLVTTFLFYQTMAYVGSQFGATLASMERGDRQSAEHSFGMAKLLGGIDVQLRDARGEWRTVGTYLEAGPIASDTKVIRLPQRDASEHGPLHVRLRMAKGSWRVDRVALAALGGAVSPIRVRPARAERRGKDDATALATLRSGVQHLVLLPGDDVRLVFDLPQRTDSLELFLESEGYYYEWMRREWLAEENFAMAALVVADPAEGLRRLAPAYHTREAGMENLFWASRFNRRVSNATR